MGRIVRAVAVVALLTSSSGCVWLARVSHHDPGGADGADTRLPQASADGRYVAFVSSASGGSVWRRDLVAGTTERVDVLPGGGGIPGEEGGVTISGDGRYVTFDSTAGGIVPEDDNGDYDVFLRDLDDDVTTLVSVGTDGTAAEGPSFGGRLSDDGGFVAFSSQADGIVDEELPLPPDDFVTVFAFVRDLTAGTTSLASVAPDGSPAPGRATDVSDGGLHVVFNDNRTRDDDGWLTFYGDVWVRDTAAGTTALVSETAFGDLDQGEHWGARITPDGSVVAFVSDDSLVNPGGALFTTEVHVRDLATGEVRSSGCAETAQLNGLSADGRLLFFTCDAPLTPGDIEDGEPYELDAFVLDRVTFTHTMLLRSADIARDGLPFPEGLDFVPSSDGLTYSFATTSHLEAGQPDDGLSRVYSSAVLPEVKSVTPATVTRGATTAVTLRGIGFVDGMVVDASRTEGPGRHIVDGTTITDVTVLSPYEATVQMAVDADAPVGERFFAVTVASPTPAGRPTVGGGAAPSVS